MHITLTGKQISIGDSFRTHVEEAISAAVDKYFGNAIEANVVLSRNGPLMRADISVHIGRGILLRGQGDAADPYAAFDAAADRVTKRLRRNKRRLRDHHKHQDSVRDVQQAQQYVLAAETDDSSDGHDAAGAPAVIAEMTTEIDTLTVSEAVMRLDLGDLPALLFRNSVHGGLNMIYRRADGHIGWVDPGDRRASS
ncbi:MAG: ribosome-associated translation inhibitor RaiA [Alphaproteobacteria bacterium]|mgnify:CR=1 FL=1